VFFQLRYGKQPLEIQEGTEALMSPAETDKIALRPSFPSWPVVYSSDEDRLVRARYLAKHVTIFH
jgi:hypothetical protein